MGASKLTFRTWRKSSYSGGNSNCVEVAHSAAAATVGIRDSKSPTTGTLTVPRTAWVTFLASAPLTAGS